MSENTTPMSAISANANATPTQKYTNLDNANKPGESKTSISTPNFENAPENSTSDYANEEQPMTKTCFFQISSNDEKRRHSVVNANAIILEEPPSPLDILMCPEVLFPITYFHGLIVKVVEYILIAMIMLLWRL